MGRLAGIARRDKKRAPMEALERSMITRDAGVVGDFRGKPGDRQVTLLSARAWRAACDELGKDIPWTVRRSNLFLDDFDIPQSDDCILQIGAVRLRTTIEIDPCSRMDEQVPGLRDALIPDWRGGIGCTVLSDGEVSVGDTVSLIE